MILGPIIISVPVWNGITEAEGESPQLPGCTAVHLHAGRDRVKASLGYFSITPTLLLHSVCAACISTASLHAAKQQSDLHACRCCFAVGTATSIYKNLMVVCEEKQPASPTGGQASLCEPQGNMACRSSCAAHVVEDCSQQSAASRSF